jgi:hypothetical protein
MHPMITPTVFTDAASNCRTTSAASNQATPLTTPSHQ